MELRHLRYFVKVAEKLNFRSAAEELNVSHPALSKQIKDLEYELDTKLLGRNTASVWLTDSGKIFLDHAKDILERVNVAVTAIKGKSTNEHVLTVANAGPLAIVLNNLLKEFRLRHPGVDIHMVDIPPWNQVPALRRGECQIGLVGEQHLVQHPSIGARHILDSRFGVVLSSDHPLAKKEKLYCSDIVREKIYFMGANRFSNHLRDIRRMLPRGKLSSRNAKMVESIGSLITMISSGQGISLLPESFQEGREKSIRFIPLEDSHADVRFQLWAIWSKEDQSQALKDFVALMDEDNMLPRFGGQTIVTGTAEEDISLSAQMFSASIIENTRKSDD